MPTDPNPQDKPSSLSGSLCLGCRFHREITTDRGSRFLLCERSRHEPWFPKFPPQPQRVCLGFERPA